MTEKKDKETWKLPQIPPLPPGVPLSPGLQLLPLSTASPLMPDVMRLLRFPSTYTGWSLPQFPTASPASSNSSTTRQEQFRPNLAPPSLATSPQSPASLDDGIRDESVTPRESANAVLFKSGTLLSCGTDGSSVKRVEDLTAVDFVLAGSLQLRYRLEWCRILSMHDAEDCVVIHLTPGDMEQARVIRLSPAQPLFVPGKGWSSRRPEASQRRHGLRCCLLSVGDRVVSLIPRAAPAAPSSLDRAATVDQQQGSAWRLPQTRKRPRGDAQEDSGTPEVE